MPTHTATRTETIPAAAARLGVSTRTIRRYIADGRITASRVGPRLIRVHTASVDAMLAPMDTAHRAGL